MQNGPASQCATSGAPLPARCPVGRFLPPELITKAKCRDDEDARASSREHAAPPEHRGSHESAPRRRRRIARHQRDGRLMKRRRSSGSAEAQPRRLVAPPPRSDVHSCVSPGELDDERSRFLPRVADRMMLPIGRRRVVVSERHTPKNAPRGPRGDREDGPRQSASSRTSREEQEGRSDGHHESGGGGANRFLIRHCAVGEGHILAASSRRTPD